MTENERIKRLALLEAELEMNAAAAYLNAATAAAEFNTELVRTACTRYQRALAVWIERGGEPR